jgi:ligand-binding sensor domain-containing protein
MKKGSYLHTVICFIIILVSLSGEAQHIQSVNLTTEEGILDNEVYFVMQDSKDYLWISTNSGVSRFDGKNYEHFTVDNGLPVNAILETYEDYKGRIWFIPYNLRLSYYENGKIYPYEYINNLSLEEKRVFYYNNMTFHVDSSDKVYFCSSSNSYHVNQDGELNVEKLKTKDRRGLKIHIKNVKHLLSENNVDFLLKKDFLLKDDYDFLEDKNVDTLFINLPLNNRLVSSRFYLSIFKDDIFYTSMFNKFGLTKDFNHWEYLEFDNRITYITVENEQLYIALLNEGVYIYDINNLKNEPIRIIPNKSASSIIIDKNGGLWVSTVDAGIFYIPDPNIQVSCYETSAPYEYIKLYQGTKLLVSQRGDIFEVNTRKKIASLEEVIGAVRIDPITNELILGGERIYKYDGDKITTLERNITVPKDSSVCRTYAVKDFVFFEDRIVMGSHGLFDLDRETGKILRLTSKGRKIKTLKKWKDGILLGTQRGLYFHNGTSVRPLLDHNEILSAKVYDITTLNDDSTIVIGSAGRGLYFFQDSIIKRITKEDGLLSNEIKKVKFWKGNLFALTNQGLNVICFECDGVHDYKIYQYGKSDGLPEDKINDILFEGDDVYILNENFLSKTNYKNIFKQAKKVPTYIKSFKVMDKDTLSEDLMKFDYNKNFISIIYQGVRLGQTSGIQYRYKLVGLSDKWSYTDHNEIRFASLASGPYTFFVEAKNEDGIWGDPAKVEFVISLPVWKEWWFILCVGLFVLVVGYLIINERMKRIRKENKLQIDMLELRQKALTKQLDPHFLFNSMNSIQALILGKETRKAASYLARFSTLMRKILHQSASSFVTVHDEIESITNYLILEQLRFEDKPFKFQFIYDDDLNIEEIIIPSFFIQPIVENVIRHAFPLSPREGELSIEFTRAGMNLEIKIIDNGIGIKESMRLKMSKEKKHISMGTHITNQRIDLLNLQFPETDYNIDYSDVLSDDGSVCGTRVEFQLPIHFK